MLVVQTFSGDDIKFKMYAFIGWGMYYCYCFFVVVWFTLFCASPCSGVDILHLKMSEKCLI